jgi:hypothetical protein
MAKMTGDAFEFLLAVKREDELRRLAFIVMAKTIGRV